MGQRAECVMLNNGIHIVEAVKTLAGLLSTEERHQIKKHQLFREFTRQNGKTRIDDKRLDLLHNWGMVRD